MPQHYPSIAREGWPVIAATVAGAAVVAFVDPGWTLPFGAAALALALKFRDPARTVPPEPLGVVSPVDGVVESVEADGDLVRIRLRIERFGAYSARAPVEGKVADFRAANAGQRGMRIHTDEGDDVVLILNRAPSFARPKALVGYGARVGQGQRCAWLRLARIAEVTVPAGSRLCVEPGRRVLAGSELLAVLVHD